VWWYKLIVRENVFDCLRREVREETGLKVTKIYGEAESEAVRGMMLTTNDR